MGKKEEKVECCHEHHHHSEITSKLSKEMPSDDVINDVSELFKVFGDITRIKIMYALYKSEMCVCDLAETLEMTQSAISHQLSILKRTKLVKARREGKSIFYSLADDHVTTIIAQGIEHVEED